MSEVETGGTVEALVLHLLVDKLVAGELPDLGHVVTDVVNDPLVAVLDEMFDELQGLVNLPPVAVCLCEASVYHWHDFVKVLVVAGGAGYLEQKSARCAPGIAVGCLDDFCLHLGVVHDGVFATRQNCDNSSYTLLSVDFTEYGNMLDSFSKLSIFT